MGGPEAGTLLLGAGLDVCGGAQEARVGVSAWLGWDQAGHLSAKGTPLGVQQWWGQAPTQVALGLHAV